MDRRQKKTRAAIFTAFSSLLAEKSYGRITVQDIIDAADVGRTTFYAHFETKDDLLREMCDDMFRHVFSAKLGAELTHDFSLETGNPRAMVTHVLYHLLDLGGGRLELLTGESGELFLRFFRRRLNEFVSRYLLPESISGRRAPRDFLVNHIASSFVGMVQWWVACGLRQSPEELADYFMEAVTPIL